jgi:hypothetical protein
MSVGTDIEEVFPILLGGNADVVALAGPRLFPNRIPQRGEMPAVIWRRLSGGPLGTLAGKSGTRKAQFQVECWSATSQEEARTLRGYVESGGVEGSG